MEIKYALGSAFVYYITEYDRHCSFSNYFAIFLHVLAIKHVSCCLIEGLYYIRICSMFEMVRKNI